MRRFIAALGICALLAIGGSVGTAHAVDEHAPHSDPNAGAHPHHVHTGGGCRDLSGPDFEPGNRGRHRASNESGSETGPFHGTCASHSH